MLRIEQRGRYIWTIEDGKVVVMPKNNVGVEVKELLTSIIKEFKPVNYEPNYEKALKDYIQAKTKHLKLIITVVGEQPKTTSAIF